jgi:hypothetical protein
VLVFRDVTELRRLERMRHDFVANVSHELKTPLASIKAYTETLLDWALHDENVNVRFLKRIEEQADRLNELILDLLSLARLESGQEVYQHGPLELAGVVASCVDSHRDRIEAKGQTLVLDLGPVGAGTRVLADEEAVRQILDNLIDNAIKYTPEGGTVRVSCAITAEGVALEVFDTGIGIPRDDLPRVFERFYRSTRRGAELGGPGSGSRSSSTGPVDRRPGGVASRVNAVPVHGPSPFSTRLPDPEPGIPRCSRNRGPPPSLTQSSHDSVTLGRKSPGASRGRGSELRARSRTGTVKNMRTRAQGSVVALLAALATAAGRGGSPRGRRERSSSTDRAPSSGSARPRRRLQRRQPRRDGRGR